MGSELIWIAGIGVVLLTVLAFFLGVFNPIFEFIQLFGFLDFVLLLLLIAILIGAVINFDGYPRIIAISGLFVLSFIFLFIPNFVITQGFGSLFSFGFFGFFAIVIILDALLPPWPSAELIMIIPLKKYFGIPFWLGEAISLGLAVIAFFIILQFYPFVWEMLLENINFDLFHIIIYIAYFIVVTLIIDRLVE